MALRSFVSFEADFPVNGRPAGREMADFVSSVLAGAGLEHDTPQEREGWAWTILSQQEFTQVEMIVGLADDGPRQWLITMDGHFSLARGLAIGEKADEEREMPLRPICLALDQAFQRDRRFREIRWYTQEEYDDNHGATWSRTPDGSNESAV
jgi:hypothetical protein